MREVILNTGLLQVKICNFRLYRETEASRTLWGIRSDLFSAQNNVGGLDANKATGHDGISVKILKTGAKEISLSLSTIYNSCIKKVSGHVTGKKGTGHQSIKNRTRTPKRIADL